MLHLQLPAAARGKALGVRYHHKSRAVLSRQLQHQIKHLIGGTAVKVACRLIGQHAIGLRYQCAGNGYALALAA